MTKISEVQCQDLINNFFDEDSNKCKKRLAARDNATSHNREPQEKSKQ